MTRVVEPVPGPPSPAPGIAPSPRGRLVARTVPVTSLDRATTAAAYRLFASLYEGTDRARFERDLSEKQLIVLLHDRNDRTLQGFSTIHVGDVVHRGRPATLVYSGDTAIHPAYWGQKRLQREFSRVLLRQKLRHPTRPLLWFLISKGYKTYLLLTHHFPTSIPRYDRPLDSEMQATLDDVALRRFGTAYNPGRGIVTHPTPRERVRRDVAPLGGPLLNDPHVSFFAARNPGHANGDELACLAEIHLVDPVRIIARSWRHTLARRQRG
jgi:hypothetical protein